MTETEVKSFQTRLCVADPFQVRVGDGEAVEVQFEEGNSRTKVGQILSGNVGVSNLKALELGAVKREVPKDGTGYLGAIVEVEVEEVKFGFL